MAPEPSPKIVELSDLSDVTSDEEFFDCDDPESVPIKFKESVLKNRRMFEKQLLDTAELDPNEIFELPSIQENEGDQQALMLAMEQCTIPIPNQDVEENKLVYLSKSMEPIPGFDGVFKKLIVKGTGACPPVDSIVTIHYNAYAEDEASGEVVSFDSTVLRSKTKSFMRGQGQVITGLDIAVGTMKTGEQADYIFSPDNAFGLNGCPPRVPAAAYVYFRVELIQWIDSCDAEAYGKMPKIRQKEAPFLQMLDAAKSQKRLGTSYVEKQNYFQAARAYKQALDWIETHGYANEEEEMLGQKLCLALNLDLALVYLKLNRPKKTCIYTREALNIDPKNPKAHYRKGLAQEKLGNYAEARRSLLDAKRILPNDPSINRALHDLNAKIEREEFIERDLARKMMGAKLLEKQNAAASVSDEFEIWTEKELKNFIGDSTRMQKIFPQGMSACERSYLEVEVKRLNLKFAIRPSLKGEEIFVVQK